MLSLSQGLLFKFIFVVWFLQLIIGVSACSDSETMEAAFAAGIDAFIPKPFTLKSFNETYASLAIAD